jgi:hypothetical protein
MFKISLEERIPGKEPCGVGERECMRKGTGQAAAANELDFLLTIQLA